MATGIDVSNNNGKSIDDIVGAVDWTTVEFAFIKATESLNFVDRTYPLWREQAVRRGIPDAAYHFAHPDQNSAKDEAEFFLRHAEKGVMAPGLDFETRGNINPLRLIGVAKARVWIDEWCTIVGDAWNQTPFFYSFRDYTKLIKPSWPLWLASASGQPGTYKEYMGMQVWIEQWGQLDGIDRNESYLPIFPLPPGPIPLPVGDDDMAFVLQYDGTEYLLWDGKITPLNVVVSDKIERISCDDAQWRFFTETFGQPVT